jgi:zinc protease
LDEGSDKHNSVELAEQLEGLGADLSIYPGYDFTQVSLEGLSYTRNQLLASFVEVLLSPKFEQKEFERVRKQVQGSLAKVEDDPEQYSDRLMAQLLFQDHPYALPTMGEPKSLARLRRSDVLAYYKKNYIPGNTMIAVVGDFDELFVKQVTTQLGTWLSEQKGELSQAKAPTQPKSGVHLKTKKGLVQAQIRLGHLFIDRSHPDFLSLRAANFALGGAFGSRLNQRVRDDLGLTYGISSGFDARRFTGPFVIETFTRNEKVGEAIQATLEVYRNFVAKGLTSDELEAAKSVMIGQFPRVVETTESLANQMLALRFYGISDSYLTQYIRNVRSLNLDQVNATLKKYFHPDQLNILVYGDGASIEKQVSQFGSVTVMK